MVTTSRRLKTIVCLLGTYQKGDRRPPAPAGYLEFHAMSDDMRTLPEQLEICVRNLDGYPCRGVMHRRGLDNTLPYCQKCGSQDPGVMFIIRRAPMREHVGIIGRIVDFIRRSRAWLVSAWIN